ncbi:MAG: hypothetical protein MUC83_07645 [Pirellula sp.]|nr:hypothetical protein [Pirellula sp.]
MELDKLALRIDLLGYNLLPNISFFRDFWQLAEHLGGPASRNTGVLD